MERRPRKRFVFDPLVRLFKVEVLGGADDGTVVVVIEFPDVNIEEFEGPFRVGIRLDAAMKIADGIRELCGDGEGLSDVRSDEGGE